MKPSEKEMSTFVPGGEEHNDWGTIVSTIKSGVAEHEQNIADVKRSRALSISKRKRPSSSNLKQAHPNNVVKRASFGVAKPVGEEPMYPWFRQRKSDGQVIKGGKRGAALYTVYDATPIEVGGETYYRFRGSIARTNGKFYPENLMDEYIAVLKKGTFSEGDHALLNNIQLSDTGAPPKEKYRAIKTIDLFGDGKIIMAKKGDVVEGNVVDNGKILVWVGSKIENGKTIPITNRWSVNDFEKIGQATAAPASNSKTSAAPEASSSASLKKAVEKTIPTALMITPILGLVSGFGVGWIMGKRDFTSLAIFSASGLALGFVPTIGYAILSEGSSALNSTNTSSPGKILSVDEIKKIITAEMLKDGGKEPDVSNLVKTFTDNEAKALYLTSKMPKDQNDPVFQKRFPELFKTKPTNEEEALKRMGFLAEKIQGEYGVSGLSGSDYIASMNSGARKMFSI